MSASISLPCSKYSASRLQIPPQPPQAITCMIQGLQQQDLRTGPSFSSSHIWTKVEVVEVKGMVVFYGLMGVWGLGLSLKLIHGFQFKFQRLEGRRIRENMKKCLKNEPSVLFYRLGQCAKFPKLKGLIANWKSGMKGSVFLLWSGSNFNSGLGRFKPGSSLIQV